MTQSLTVKNALALAGLLATSALMAALYFEHVLGFIPCQLCLWQRWPYYMGIPLVVMALGLSRLGARRMLALVGFMFAVSAALGIYHAGVEWGLWAGPAGCAAGAAPPASGDDLMAALSRPSRLVSCTEASWRFLGLSFAGWNAVVSLAVVAIAATSLRRDHGSNSVSQ